jgi:acetylornithine deacetylase/succinyl-diaminopimelate desuccinylase-like protein
MRNITFVALAFFLALQPARSQSGSAPPAEEEIEKIARDKKVVEAFRVIDELEPQTHKDLIFLTEIPAPPFKEEERAKQFKKMLEEAGADEAWIDEAGNVVAIKNGTKSNRTVALDAHLDTVFPEGTDVTVKMRGDTLKAPGIGDDTRGLMVVLTVLRSMKKANIQTLNDIMFIGSVGEEGLGDLRGTKYLFEKGQRKIDSWISIDGGEIGRVVNGGLGSTRYKVTFIGPGGHSWGAFGLANPHHALGKAIDNFATQATVFTSQGPRTSFNVGRMGGGTSVNSIPFESWMEVDMRSIDPKQLGGIDSVFRSAMNGSLAQYNKGITKGPPLTMNLEMIGSRPSGVESPDLPLLKRTAAAIRYLGEEPDFSTSSTNSNIPISLGIPAVTLGRGGVGGGAHSLGEWWMNKNGDEAIKLALLLVIAEAGLSK